MTDVRQLPEAFLLKMQKLLGEEFGQYLESFKEEWKPGLRVNTLKLSPGELAELVPWNLEPVPWADNGFYYDGTLDGEVLRPSKHPAYYAGLYYLQEPSAMTPAAMLPETGCWTFALHREARAQSWRQSLKAGECLCPMTSAIPGPERFLKIWSWPVRQTSALPVKGLKSWPACGRSFLIRYWWTPPVPGKACSAGMRIW